jgi:very-short-patch-repair endonuclease
MEPVSSRSVRLANCVRTAGRQQGIVTRSQALGAGLSSSSIHRLTASKLWTIAHPGVYRLWEPTTEDARWRQDLAAAVLWLAAWCAVSRRAAAALWGLDGFESACVELSTTQFRRSTRPGVTVHRIRSLARADVCTLAGLPVTTVARTILDVAAFATAAQVEVAMESALRRRLTTRERLEAQLSRSPATLPGRGIMRSVLSDSPAVATESALEAKVWRLLVQAGLPRPTRQYEVRDEGGRFVARLDFAYPNARLAIEADGYRFHSSRSDWRRNVTRHNALTELGWTLLHATWEDAHRPGGELYARVRAFLTLKA